jgi:hypothetical protein
MTKGTYFGASWGSPWGIGGGAYIDNHGRIYPQGYFGSPGLNISSGYTPDLEGFLTGLSVSRSFGQGPIKGSFGTSGTSPTVGFSVGTPGVGATYGVGPYRVPGEWNPSAAGELNGEIYNTGFTLPSEENSPQPTASAADNSTRYLARKTDNLSTSVFDAGAAAVPFAPIASSGISSFQGPATAARTRISSDPAQLPDYVLPSGSLAYPINLPLPATIWMTGSRAGSSHSSSNSVSAQ